MSRLLTNKVVVITGAGRGLGWGLARGFAQAGAYVCIVDVNEAELRQSYADVKADGGHNVMSLVADVCDLAAMERVVTETVARWGRLDAMINNAAIFPLISFDETSPAMWQEIIDVNLAGVYHGVKAVWNQMKQQGGGHCLAIASGASVRGFVNEVAYCAAKHAIEGFTKALAMEAEPYNIAVNTMGPGKLIKPTSITRAEAAKMPPEEQARWLDPIELAPAFAWLISQPPARFTGLRFDAGPLADAIAADGYDFEFAPEKVTLYVPDFVERLEQRKNWTQRSNNDKTTSKPAQNQKGDMEK
jgi:NAD(P)-dependent dehydrogenase (short-subunit alcohol dehydrogenase family)